MTFGILISCYVLVAPGHYDWVKGREIGESGDNILFAAENRQAEYVNNNECNYLEDPVAAYARILKQKEQMAKETAKERKTMVDKRTVGDRPWCLVDHYGRRVCTYDTLAHCLKATDRLSHCEQKELND